MTTLHSMAPEPVALRRRVRRMVLRRRLSTPLLALAAIVLYVAVIGLSLGLGLLGVALLILGVRWTGEPLRSLVHTGPLEWF